MRDRIKALRKALHLTQQDFAKRIGSVQNTITGYETGKRIPSNQVIALICKEFYVNEEWLRTGNGDMFLQHNDTLSELIAKYNLSGIDARILEAYISMPDAQRAAIGCLICSLADAITSGQTDTVEGFLSTYNPLQTVKSIAISKSPAEMTDAEIDAEVMAYRRDLEMQKKAAIRLSASGDVNG